MKYFGIIMILLALSFLAPGVSGCKGKAPTENAGEKMDKAQEAGPAEKAGKKIDETMEKVKESGKKINDGVEKTVEKIDEKMQMTKEKVNDLVGN